MYKKSADLIHLHERTANHSTKGGARGTPWFDPLTDEEKELIEVRRAYAIIRVQFGRIRWIKKGAKEAGNIAHAKECSILMRKLIKQAKKLASSKGIDQTKFRW